MTRSTSILDEIVAAKHRELEVTRHQFPQESLLEAIRAATPPAFDAALQGDGLNIIAEVKYRSPSRGPFPCQLAPVEVARQYRDSGAVALSVVTETAYFAGASAYLEDIREEFPALPLLRKDFLFEPYQVIESRAWGASAILAIVACLESSQLASLLCSAGEFQLGVLVEVHDPWELEIALHEGAGIIGVNNRNLNDFQVDLATSFDIARRLEGEDGTLLISESGLSERAQLLELRDAGFSGFLIGSHFMNSQDPGKALRELLAEEKGGN